MVPTSCRHGSWGNEAEESEVEDIFNAFPRESFDLKLLRQFVRVFILRTYAQHFLPIFGHDEFLMIAAHGVHLFRQTSGCSTARLPRRGPIDPTVTSEEPPVKRRNHDVC
jgi:hypothetical protein